MGRIDAAILAGGRARRLGGVLKGLLEVGGRAIVERQIDALAPLVGEVLLVAGDPTPYEHLRGVRLIADRAPGQGPLAGISAAFAASRADALLVVGCDLPFLDPRLLALVRDHAPEAQAVVPRVADRPQALHARYARSMAPAVDARLARGELRLLALLDELAPVWLDEPLLRAIDPELRGLTNINTHDDLARARADSQ
jgi:molybdopterin-guanine dinucleotide biosynthesis protein A